MLHVYYGSDRDKVFAALSREAAKLERSLGVSAHRPEEVSELEELSAARDMFGNAQVVVIRDMLAELSDELIAKLVNSSNHFLLLEEKLLAADKKRLRGAKLESFDKSASALASEERAKKQEFSKVFKLTDALGARDRKRAWVEYHRLLMSGHDASELYYKLWWQSKNMLLASREKSAKAADLKPFVYDKAKRSAGNYTWPELVKLSDDLIDAMYNSNRGRGDLSTRLETVLMNI